jgi:hypothetical protein
MVSLLDFVNAKAKANYHVWAMDGYEMTLDIKSAHISHHSIFIKEE